MHFKICYKFGSSQFITLQTFTHFKLPNGHTKIGGKREFPFQYEKFHETYIAVQPPLPPLLITTNVLYKFMITRLPPLLLLLSSPPSVVDVLLDQEEEEEEEEEE